MIRTSFLALSLVMALSAAASAQSVRRSGPADPRYYPDLYKGPGWGYTLSEYYTFGNKADGPYGYAIGGYRYGSNYDIQRWKEATGTDVQPGYYLQRWRERRNERLGISPPPEPSAKSSRRQPPEPIPTPAEEVADDSEEETEDEAIEPDEEYPVENRAKESVPATLRSTRRNVNSRGLAPEKASQPSRLTGPAQSESRLSTANKFRGMRSTDAPAAVDKN